jgi:hypothetical protein
VDGSLCFVEPKARIVEWNSDVVEQALDLVLEIVNEIVV